MAYRTKKYLRWLHFHRLRFCHLLFNSIFIIWSLFPNIFIIVTSMQNIRISRQNYNTKCIPTKYRDSPHPTDRFFVFNSPNSSDANINRLAFANLSKNEIDMIARNASRICTTKIHCRLNLQERPVACSTNKATFNRLWPRIVSVGAFCGVGT